MASNTHGGYRQPSNPAPVSGPGALSRRTDGGPQQTTVPMTGMGYGENADFNEIQAGAPLAAAPSATNTRSRNRVPAMNSGAAASPLFAPTARPDEPVTAGAPVGPGPSSTPGPQASYSLADSLAKLLPYDDSGDIKRFYDIAVSKGW